MFSKKRRRRRSTPSQAQQIAICSLGMMVGFSTLFMLTMFVFSSNHVPNGLAFEFGCGVKLHATPYADTFCKL